MYAALPGGGNGHAEYNLTSSHASEASILISMHLDPYTRGFLNKTPDLGGNIVPQAALKEADSRVEHNMTRAKCTDASYKI